MALVPRADAKGDQELKERVRDAVQRTDKDLGQYIHRDKLNDQQRAKLDSAMKDLDGLREAVAKGQWEKERGRLESAVENIDFVVKNAQIDEGDRQTLGIDVYTLRVILDSWKQ
jgi:DNA topoisomerase VI subunit B